MRKLTVGEFISLDGVVESPERWHMPYVDEEMFAAMWPAGGDTDTLLLGRVRTRASPGRSRTAPTTTRSWRT